MRKITGITVSHALTFLGLVALLLPLSCFSAESPSASTLPQPSPPSPPSAPAAPSSPPADGDVAILLRLYEGSRGESSGADKVVSSYYLKLLPTENVFPDTDVSKEEQTLKRVFNLTDIKLMTQAAMPLRKESGKTPSQVIVLDRRQLLIQMSAVSFEKNQFHVEVLEDGKPPRSLLESKIILPEKKTTALGFEDSAGKIYFLSFHRGENLPEPPSPAEPPTPPDKKGDIKQPRLTHPVEPAYPEEAKKAGIEGSVVVEAVTDATGSVVEAKAVKGPTALQEAAVSAIKQWKYEPFYIKGKPKGVKFTVVVRFNLDKEKKRPPVISATEQPKIIKKVSPQYPKEALKAGVQGKVVLEAAIDTKGNVVDAVVIDGHSLLRVAALEAIKHWQYEPFVKDGVKKPVRFTVVMDFKLEDK